jgi:hypothetical protein
MVEDQNGLTEAVGRGKFLEQEIYYKDGRLGDTWGEADTLGGKESNILNRSHPKAVVHAQPMATQSSASHLMQSEIGGSTNSQFQIDDAQSLSPQADRPRKRRSIPEAGSEVTAVNPSSTPIKLESQEERSSWSTKHSPGKGQTPAPKQAPVRRVSTFKEVGIEHLADSLSSTAAVGSVQHEGVVVPWFKKLIPYPLSRRYVLASGSPPPVFPSRARLTLLISLLVLVFPCIWLSPSVHCPIVGVKGRVTKQKEWKDARIGKLSGRGNSPTDTCTRWSHQSEHMACSLGGSRRIGLTKHTAALVDGILYIYGGQSKREAQQSTDTWSKWQPQMSNCHTDNLVVQITIFLPCP